MKPGIYENISNDDYHTKYLAWMSSTGLRKFDRSPAHFKHYQDTPQSRGTKALIFGDAYHKYLLEPDIFDDHFAVKPGYNKTLKGNREKWAKFKIDHHGKPMIDEGEMAAIRAMKQSIMDEPGAKWVLDVDHKVEQTIIWKDRETGVKCRCRPDMLFSDYGAPAFVDVKTSMCADPRDFPRVILNYGYHIQLAFYRRGISFITGKPLEAIDVYILAVEKSAPFLPALMKVREDALQEGDEICGKVLGDYKASLNMDYWPGYQKGKEIMSVTLPPYGFREMDFV